MCTPGRCAFTRRLKGPADKVSWHSSGLYYLLVVGVEVQIYAANDNACLSTLVHNSRVNQAVFTSVVPVQGASIEDQDASLRVASISDDKMLFIHSILGVKVL